MILRLPFLPRNMTLRPRLIVIGRGLPAWRDAAVERHELVHVAQRLILRHALYPYVQESET